MIKYCIIFLSFYSLILSNTSLNYETALKESLEYDFDIENLKNEKKGFKEDIDFEKLGYFPKVDLIYSINRINKDIERESSAYKQNKNTININTRLNIYDFEARETKIDILKKEIILRNLEIDKTKVQLATKILDLYVEVYKSRESIDFLTQLYQLYEKKKKMKIKLFKQGIIGSIDVIKDKNDFLNIEKKINEENTKLAYTISIFNHETGILLLDNIDLEPLCVENEFHKFDSKISTVQTKINQTKIKKFYKEIDYYEKTYMPTFEFYYNNEFYNDSDKDFQIDSNYNKRDYQLGIRLNWSISNIFNSRYQKVKKKLEIEKNKILYKKYRKEFKNNFYNKYLSIKKFGSYKEIKFKVIDNIKKEIEMNKRLYNQGLEYKYKIIESKIKLVNEQHIFRIKQIDNDKNKKYLSILLERELDCIHH